MLTEIFVISGFLGAGKTTLIQKLLREEFQNEKVVLIENDFGDVSVDAALLKSGGIEVKEMNSGCICCSLSGDFINALREILNRFRPDKIIIEPSGVGKLSDIVKACSDPHILSLAKLKAKITIVDVKRCKMYLDNFGEFFEDQIKNADTILLSRVQEFPDKINAAQGIINRLNPNGIIIPKPWGQIKMDEILYPRNHYSVHSENHIHKHDASCGHNHDAKDIFDTVTIETDQIFSLEDLKSRISLMERRGKGRILRAKGILRGPNGYMNLQYLHGDIKVTKCTTKGNILCIIGENLNKQELCNLFHGV